MKRSFQKYKRAFHPHYHKVHTKHIVSPVSYSLLSYAKMSKEELFAKLQTSDKGLHSQDCTSRRKTYGFNEVVQDKPVTSISLFLSSCKNPFVILLIFLGIISFIVGERNGTIIIIGMVFVGIITRFIQEYRSNIAAEKLKKMVSVKCLVTRQKGLQAYSKEIPVKQLVPGDIIQLSAGNFIPADIRLISSKDLFISQSTLTGESFPVEKNGNSSFLEPTNNIIEIPNICLMGTNVLNGTAVAVVLKTGDATYFGSISKTITEQRPLTNFDIGINQVSSLLIRLMLIIAPCVFLINGVAKGNVFEAFLFALSVAVGLTPEMLPMIITTNLAKGALNMAREKVIVKRLNAIQNFGAMNILCTDKTGTLTENQVILEKYLDIEGKENQDILWYAYINSYYQTSLKNLLDQAILNHRDLEKILSLQNQFQKIDELPFDFNRRRMSVVVTKDPNLHTLICKGACEEVLSVCKNIQNNGSSQPLTPELHIKLKKLEDTLNQDGLRVLGLAYKNISNVKKEYRTQDEESLTFLGFLAFLDPPKESTKEALSLLQKYNVKVKILTGDNALTTQKICQWIELPIEKIVLGSEIDQMNEEELKQIVEEANIFAKLHPLQKGRVISALKANGHIVGYLGDGINDAPALLDADVGISVDTSVDIAKESSDIIMLEKNLLFLSKGVLEGRRTFGNMIKYIKMATSSNFGNIFSVLGASALFPFLPMLPVQLLTQNLLYDLSQTAIPFDKVDEEFVLSPRKWDPKGIAKFMFFIGPISSVFDYVTFAILWFVFGANSLETQSIFQSGWFIEGLLSQTLIVHMIRTKQIPFFQSIAALPLLLTTLAIITIGVYIPYSYIGQSIGFVSLPGNYFYWLILVLLSYCILTQVVKNWFIKKFNTWL